MRLLVNIDVPDLAAAEAFYSAAFGLRRGRRFGIDALELIGAEVPICEAVAAVLAEEVGVDEAMTALLSRPLRAEF